MRSKVVLWVVILTILTISCLQVYGLVRGRGSVAGTASENNDGTVQGAVLGEE